MPYYRQFDTANYAWSKFPRPPESRTTTLLTVSPLTAEGWRHRTEKWLQPPRWWRSHRRRRWNRTRQWRLQSPFLLSDQNFSLNLILLSPLLLLEPSIGNKRCARLSLRLSFSLKSEFLIDDIFAVFQAKNRKQEMLRLSDELKRLEGLQFVDFMVQLPVQFELSCYFFWIFVHVFV